jgi:hypothetical protein
MVPALGAIRTYTLSTTGATEGARLRFSGINNTTTNYASMFGGLQQLMNATGGVLALDVVFTGGSWTIENITRFP